jgi:hypothetical protein
MSIISVMTIISHDQLSFNTSEIGFILLVSYISLIPPFKLHEILFKSRTIGMSPWYHHYILLGGLEHLFYIFLYIYIGNVIIPTDELHHFS